jgi:hypothetical protein
MALDTPLVNGTAARRTWSDDDFAFLFEENGGPCWVPFFGPEHPEVLIDFAGIESLVLQRRVGNPLQEAASQVAELRQAVARRLSEAAARVAAEGEEPPDDEDDEATEAAEAAPDAPEARPSEEEEEDNWAFSRRLAKFHDEIGKAVWLSPPWQPLDDVIVNGQRPGTVSVFTLTMDRRNALVDILYRGVDALKPFRQQPVGASAPLHGGGLRGEEPGGVPDPPRTDAPEVLVRPEHLVASPGPPGRAPGRRARSAPR